MTYRLAMLVPLLLALLSTVSSAQSPTVEESVLIDLKEGVAHFLVLFDQNKPLPPAAAHELADDPTQFVLYEDGVARTNFFTSGAIEEIGGEDRLTGYAVYVRGFRGEVRYELQPLAESAGSLAGKVILHVPPTQDDPDAPEDGAFRLFDSHYLRVDVRSAETEGGSLGLGVDYRLSLENRLSDVGFFQFRSTGYVVEQPSEGPDDSLVSRLALGLSGESYPHLDNGGQVDLTDPASFSRLRGRGALDSWAWQLDLHGKHESSQDFGDYNLAAGVGGAMTIPWWRLEGVPLLMLPLAPLLWTDRSNLAIVQQPAFAMDFEYVFDQQGTARDSVGGDDEFWRILVEGGWTSEVFYPNTWLYLRGVLWYELDSSRAVEDADLDQNEFYEVGLKLPTGLERDRMHLVLKYMGGELPPNFATGHQFTAGVSLGF